MFSILRFLLFYLVFSFYSSLSTTKENDSKKGTEEEKPSPSVPKEWTEEEKREIDRIWRRDREDWGWDPFHDEDYDDEDYSWDQEEEEQMWHPEDGWPPKDERPTECPPLSNPPPRVSFSERKKLYFKSDQGRKHLPWEDLRDFWDKIRRRDRLPLKQWQKMESHIEKYAPEWEKLEAGQEEFRKKRDSSKP